MNVLFFLTPKSNVSYVYKDFTLRQAIEKMAYHKYSAVPIIDRDGKYIGTVTEGDFLWYIKSRSNKADFNIDHEKLSSVPLKFTIPAINVQSTMEDLMAFAVNMNFVPVVDDHGVFIGIVPRSAIMRYMYDLLQKNNLVTKKRNTACPDIFTGHTAAAP